VDLKVDTNVSMEHTASSFKDKVPVVGSLFYDSFSVTRLHSVDDRVISE
jgi:hypothetical protein